MCNHRGPQGRARVIFAFPLARAPAGCTGLAVPLEVNPVDGVIDVSAHAYPFAHDIKLLADRRVNVVSLGVSSMRVCNCRTGSRIVLSVS